SAVRPRDHESAGGGGGMKYLRYSNYRDSEDEWIDEIPFHWEVTSNRRIMSLRKETVGSKSADFALLSLTLKGIVLRDIESGDGKYPESFDTYQAVRPNDLVFCLFDMDETPRTVGLSSHFGMVTGAYTVCECTCKVNPSFVYYYYLSLDYGKRLRPFYTGLRKVIRKNTFLNIKIPIPDKDEQDAIVTFLDHETAQIDTLIAKQQQLIELLQEKRQALISYVVTKGLNPDAPMKDSGVEWLGKVPAHWEVIRLKKAVVFQRGHDLPSQNRIEGDVPIVSSSGVSGTHAKARAKPPGIVTGRYGTIGDFHLLTMDYWPLNTTLYSISLNGNDARFLRYMLMNLSPLFVMYSSKSAVPGIDRNDIHRIETVVPPLSEQIEIAQFVDDELTKIAQLITKASCTIDILIERRTALISAAVTGKIDVRSLIN
ncbi:MAG: restriction endonuclease subunit S, partial [Armatimonadetes bacterium]|nr:restriction endonuclease subunit S [Armatimonadota bacterium]